MEIIFRKNKLFPAHIIFFSSINLPALPLNRDCAASPGLPVANIFVSLYVNQKSNTYEIRYLYAPADGFRSGLRFSARAKNKGWRIDYCMVSEPMKAQVEKAYILNEAVHSDHCPAVIEVS